MKNMVRDIIKAGVLFFAVGALLSVAAPYIGAMVGLAPTASAAAATLGHTANPLWLGSFFAAFGAIDAAIRPAVSRLFHDTPADNSTDPKQASCKQAGIALALAQDNVQEAGEFYRQKLNAQRAEPSVQTYTRS